MKVKDLIGRLNEFPQDANINAVYEGDLFTIRSVRYDWTTKDGESMIDDLEHVLLEIKA